ncbi:MAG: hypothetical protein IPM69_15680 [Ignavibacteria bacterium]|nr:hypothetical protein [Ignavibacteria bacterium]
MNYEELLNRFTSIEEDFYRGTVDVIGVEAFCRETLLVLPEQNDIESNDWEQIQEVRSYALCQLARSLRDMKQICQHFSR